MPDNNFFTCIPEPRSDGTTPINQKPSNPKDTVGVKKVAFSYVPASVMLETALGMIEGGYKYGRHNYRTIGVRGSIYYDATIRHLMDWWEGEDIDPESGLSHITKAICSLVVMRDAMIQEMFTDDRPPKSNMVMADYNKLAAALCNKYPNPVPPYTELYVEPAREKK